MIAQLSLKRNLVITGGPGTGKTTSILFLLLGLLISKQYKEVYLLAPSGKAASRMKDSIKGGLGVLSDDFKTRYKDIIDRILSIRNKELLEKWYLFTDIKKKEIPDINLPLVKKRIISPLVNGKRVYFDD